MLREASSSVKRRPLLFRSFAPSPRSVSESSRRGVVERLAFARAVGWNWMNSRFWSFAPARAAIAIPSPVAIAGLVVYLYTWPAPPVAIITASAKIVSMRFLRVMILAPWIVRPLRMRSTAKVFSKTSIFGCSRTRLTRIDSISLPV